MATFMLPCNSQDKIMQSNSTTKDFFRMFSKRKAFSSPLYAEAPELNVGFRSTATYTSHATNPTKRHKPMDASPPPPYSPCADTIVDARPVEMGVDSPYSFLSKFDTVFLIDDSGSMAGRSWRETSEALAAITPICTLHDADGIDIFFLNHRNPRHPSGLGGYKNITTTAGVRQVFGSVRPLGSTPTGTRLHQLLKPYISRLEKTTQQAGQDQEESVKPLNIIVITDGVPTDDVESVIVNAARKLDACDAVSWQIGIQFFQVGRELGAAEALNELDDALATMNNIRDMVDTVPWSGSGEQTLSADNLLKIVLGSVVRRLDRRRV